MCGVLAILGGSLPVDEDVAAAALDTMRHRGPDDRGIWSSPDAWLGSRRLAVLDTSQRGHQPMVHEDTGVVLAFNGEVYNYVELREELRAVGAVFESGSDTEVVLEAYLRYGDRCFERFNGMWGLVIWDPRTRTALFSRDRFGVKPLYCTTARSRLSIASEAKALLHLYPELRRPDDRTLYEFLALGRIQGSERSFYEGISIVPKASVGTLAPGRSEPTMRTFWTYPEPGGGSDDEGAAERFAELFEDAVRIRLRSDVPVGVSLSGGLDSTAVLHGAAAGLDGGGSLTALTSIFEAAPGDAFRDERSWARMASAPYASIELEEVPAARGAWLPVFERAVWYLDAPNFSPAIVPLWAIMERAHERGIKVMLEGQGGDELLGGYVQHAALALLGRLQGNDGARRGVPRDFVAYGRSFMPLTFGLWVAREAVPPLRHSYRGTFGTASVLDDAFRERFADLTVDSPPRRLGERLVHDFSLATLPSLLHYGDAISSAHSVESRQPFLDYRLVELSVGLPDRWKVADGETKRILRSYLRMVGQNEIGARVDKLGFPTPIKQWLVADDARITRTLLLGPDARIGRYCTRPGLEKLFARTERGSNTATGHLYRLLATEVWLRVGVG